MIRLKSFPIEKADEASEFMEKHTPLTTERSPGIQLNMGHIVITYDDGEVNYRNFVDKFRNLIGKEIETIELHKHNIVRNNALIKEITPKGYKRNLSDKELLELCKAEGDEYQTAKDRTKAIIETENSNIITAKSITHSQKEIELYKRTIESYKDAK